VQAERIADALRSRGWAVDLTALCGSGDRGAGIAATPLTARCRGRFDVTAYARLRRRLQHGRPDIVIANGSATLRYAVAALMGRRRGPLLAHVSIGEPRYWLRGAAHRRLQRFLLGRVDQVIAVSQVTADQLAAVHGVAAEKVAVVPSGMPDDFLAVVAEPPTGELRILFLGSLSPEKGPLDALAVLAGLTSAMPARLRMAGEGRLRDAVLARAAELGVAGSLELVEPEHDVLPLLAWADVLVITSRSEGLPGCALEAAGAGIPTVAYAVGGTGEAVVDGVTGMLITPGDVTAFVAALSAIGADPRERARMGRAARELFRERFRLNTAADRYDEILQGLLT